MGKKTPEALWFRDTHMTIVADAASTGGRLTVIDARAPGGSGPPLHRHPNDEAFHVLEGQVAFLTDGEIEHCSTGECAFIPGGRPHAFRVLSAGARMVVISTPAGHEGLFRRAGEPALTDSLPQFEPPGDMAALGAAAASVAAEILGPPPPELAALSPRVQVRPC